MLEMDALPGHSVCFARKNLNGPPSQHQATPFYSQAHAWPCYYNHKLKLQLSTRSTNNYRNTELNVPQCLFLSCLTIE